MFANLKNKLIEEVKASPSKFQQFANAAQAAVSSSSSTPSGSESATGNENFFSITEEDTPQNSPHKPLKLPVGNVRAKGPNISPQSNNGAIPRTRKLSNSSVASDVSFRLPAYESPAVYHLQSDLDVSASEVEDSAATARLDLINKEQLYDAYKKALDRYQKYRSRYADLAKKYKDLERDSTKARSVLVETQEKAIRRISELREQCTLEQQAKAHLEEALRMEMDDMQCKMQAYQTKLTLLGENPENIIALTKSEPLLQLNNGSNITTTETSNLINLEQENNHVDTDDSKVVNLEKKLSEQQRHIDELNQRLQEATNTIDLLKKQEEENAISLAQTKQAIYSELESKEAQVNRLKTSLAEVEGKFQLNAKENGQLTAQVAELAETKEKLKAITLAKQEAEAKVISSTHIQSEIKTQLVAKEKAVADLENRLQNMLKDHEERLKDMQHQNDELSEMIRQYQTSEIALAEIDNELNRTKTENNDLRAVIEEHQRNMREMQSELEESRNQLSNIQKETEDANGMHEELKKKLEDLSNELEQVRREKEENETRVKQLESEIKIINEQNENSESETISSLKEALQKASSEASAQLKSAKEMLTAREKELKASNNKLAKLKKQLENHETNAKEIETLRESIAHYEASLTRVKQDHQLQEEKTEREKSELKEQVANILKEIGTMEEEMRFVRASHSGLEAEKRSLEDKIENMTRQSQEATDGSQRWQEQLSGSQEKLKLVEQKLQNVESENSQLAEKKCELEEKSNRLEKLLAEHDRRQNEAEIQFSHLKQQCETAEGTILKLNEKMAQVLDENSRLHNAKELMEHEYRSLQDQCESKEKEKLCVLDSNKCLENEMQAFKEEIDSLTRENNNLSEISNNLRGDLSDALEKLRVEGDKHEKVGAELKAHVKAREKLEEELREAKESLIKLRNDTSATESLEASKQLVIDLKKQLDETERMNQEKHEVIQRLQQELTQASNEAQASDARHQQTVAEKLLASASEIATLSNALKFSQENVTKLSESNKALETQIDTLESNNRSRIVELEQRLEQTTDEIKKLHQTAQNASSLEDKIQNYDQLKLENENLNALTEQLQADIRQQSEDRANVAQEIAFLKEKINSQQCELYVLNENQEKHSVELNAKCIEIAKTQGEIEELTETLTKERAELTRQTEHAKFITEQNDHIQKDLLSCQHQLADVQKELVEVKSFCEDVTGEKLKLIDQLTSAEALSKQQIDGLRVELERSTSTLETLNREVDDLNKEIENVDALKEEKNELLKQIESLKVELAERTIPVKVESATESAKATQSEAENLRKINEQLQKELEDTQYKARMEIASLTEEMDDLMANAKFMNETDTAQIGNSSPASDSDRIRREKEELESKLKTIMHDVQDVSNRNLFLEQKCENYLILEQSNERLKSQNEKLSRQLDETLVSMQHHEGITANTEFEYLKNIMFQYLTGTMNGNNETLVKVISAVLKFTPQQTQVALEKEHQRRSLLGQLNNLL